jgi:hypothetical protein
MAEHQHRRMTFDNSQQLMTNDESTSTAALALGLVPAEKTNPPPEGLLVQARRIMRGKEPLPPVPDTANLAKLLDAACAAERDCTQAQKAMDVAAQTAFETLQALEGDLSDEHAGLSEEAALQKIRETRDRLDAAALKERRTASTLANAHAAQQKALLALGRAAFDAAQTQTVRLIFEGIQNAEALLAPDFYARNTSECITLVDAFVMRTAAVCDIGCEVRTLGPRLAEAIRSARLNTATARALVANAARVLVYFQSVAPPRRKDKPFVEGR